MRCEIRKPAAVSGIAVLAAILAFCPILMCGPAEVSAAHSCCPSSQHAPRGTTGQTCPYLLLQTAKSAPVPLAVPPLQTAAIVVRTERGEQIDIAPLPCRGVTDLYLRNRVLLI
jgi:hypothetical protein